jgi:ankyrin repeat protein
LALALSLVPFHLPDGVVVGPAFTSIQRDDPVALRSLVRRGWDVNTTYCGLTPVMYAASLGRADALQSLIEMGARVDSVSTSGASALHFAALTGNAQTIDTLVRAGAEPNVRDVRGWTPLMYALTSGNAGNIMTFLNAGADPARKNYSGRDAFQIAEGLERTDLLPLLRDPSQYEQQDVNGTERFHELPKPR